MDSMEIEKDIQSLMVLYNKYYGIEKLNYFDLHSFIFSLRNYSYREQGFEKSIILYTENKITYTPIRNIDLEFELKENSTFDLIIEKDFPNYEIKKAKIIRKDNNIFLQIDNELQEIQTDKEYIIRG